METQIFIIQTMGERLAQLPEGSGQIKYFDDLRAEGWEPLHWTDLSTAQRVVYRVVMQRKKPSVGEAAGTYVGV